MNSHIKLPNLKRNADIWRENSGWSFLMNNRIIKKKKWMKEKPMQWKSNIFLWMALQVSYMILQRVSPVTHSVGNCVKRVVVIVSSVIIFKTPVSPVNAFGKIASFWFKNIWRFSLWRFFNTSLHVHGWNFFIIFFYRYRYSSCWRFLLFKGEAN